MKILFICTHNRCRSILGEAIANKLGGDRISARSAGSQPAGEVHPLTLKYLQARGYPAAGLTSQSWDLISEEPDAVITVCDSAANEACPLWLGDSPKVHWGLPDPSRVDGTEDEVRDAFFKVIDILERRIRALVERECDRLRGAELAQVLETLAKEIN
jgi:arsenate reductase (thioredoxin)